MARIVLTDDGIEFDGDSTATRPLGGAESAVVDLTRDVAAWLERHRHRVVLGPRLDARGWLQSRDGTHPSTGAYRTEEDETANGPADYALWLDGRRVGIVEAKKLAVGPQEVLTRNAVPGERDSVSSFFSGKSAQSNDPPPPFLILSHFSDPALTLLYKITISKLLINLFHRGLLAQARPIHLSSARLPARLPHRS